MRGGFFIGVGWGLVVAAFILVFVSLSTPLPNDPRPSSDSITPKPPTEMPPPGTEIDPSATPPASEAPEVSDPPETEGASEAETGATGLPAGGGDDAEPPADPAEAPATPEVPAAPEAPDVNAADTETEAAPDAEGAGDEPPTPDVPAPVEPASEEAAAVEPGNAETGALIVSEPADVALTVHNEAASTASSDEATVATEPRASTAPEVPDALAPLPAQQLQPDPNLARLPQIDPAPAGLQPRLPATADPTQAPRIATAPAAAPGEAETPAGLAGARASTAPAFVRALPDSSAAQAAPASVPLPQIAGTPRVDPSPAPLPEPVESPMAEPTTAVAEAPSAPPVSSRLPQIASESADDTTAMSEVAGLVTPNQPRLPQIGGTAETPVSADASVLPRPGSEPRALRDFAAAFDATETRPLMSVILIDDPAAGLDPALLMQFSFPVSFAIDPLHPEATTRAAALRAAGFEVLLYGTGLPEGATPADAEVALAASFNAVPEALAVLDTPESRIQGDRPVLDTVVRALADTGHGLVAFPRGLNAAEQTARRENVPAATAFRLLDDEDQRATVITRYLGRAAFAAAQDGTVVVVGRTRPETVTALFSWALGSRSEGVALAPISAVLERFSP